VKAVFIYLTLLQFCICANAQIFPELKFSHINEKDGLSTKEAECITQDKDGFIWVGTYDGLNRLDGYRVKSFIHYPADNGSLINSAVYRLMPDTAGNIWISTKDGICYYNNMLGRFIKPEGPAFSKIEEGLFSDKHNAVWITAGDTIFSVEKNMQYRAFAENSPNIPAGFSAETAGFGDISDDANGHFWTYCQHWIFLLNDKTKQVNSSFYVSNSLVRTIRHSTNGQFWIGTHGDGLFLFNNTDSTVKKVPLANNATIIYHLGEWVDKNNNKWITVGTDNGLVLLNPATLNNRAYTDNNYDDYALHGNHVYGVFADRDNILWAVTNNGVNYIEPSRQLIEIWDIEGKEGLLNGDRQGFINSFLIDRSGYWGTNWSKFGINYYSKTGHLIKVIPNLYPSNPDSIKFRTARAFSIVKQKDGTYWFTTEMGLVHYDAKMTPLALYKPPDAGNDIGFRTLVPYNDSIYWIRTRNNVAYGVYVFNTVQHKFTGNYFVRPCDKCAPLRLLDILITKHKQVYVTPRANGLYKFDAVQSKFNRVDIKNLQLQLTGNSFECMAEDSRGMLWVGTLNGLFTFNPFTNTLIKEYYADKTIGGTDIFKLCFDDGQNLWMTTERGVFCLVHHSHEILHFNTGDGLPSNSMPGFLCNGGDGYIYAGAIGYIVKFKPADLLQHRFYGQVHFAEVTVMNKPYAITKDTYGNNTITIIPGQDFFTVDFAVVNYDNPAGNRYFYKLEEGREGGQWNENENGHLSFYNLPAAKYILHVRGSYKYGGSFNNETVLYIRVLPYWWQTNVFKFAMLALAGAIVFFLVKRRISTIKKEAMLKHKIAETEMAALRAQMNPHFIFNCLNSIDNLIQKNQKEKATAYLSKFAKLIRAILENSSLEMIPCWKELECLQLYIDLEMLRLGEKFTCNFKVDEKIYAGDYKVPPTVLQPFVENAIHHGLLNKLEGDKTLTITVETLGNYIRCTIEDNGVGRTQAEIYKNINNPKYQPLGVKITGERINYFNKEAGKHEEGIVITDLFNNEGACGTQVQILIKN
jgi:ligand-binding sensor domain-containing protein